MHKYCPHSGSNRGKSFWPASITVTSLPKWVYIEANSSPMGPPPKIANFLICYFWASKVFEVKIRPPSTKASILGRLASAPVLIKRRSKVNSSFPRIIGYLNSLIINELCSSCQDCDSFTISNFMIILFS